MPAATASRRRGKKFVTDTVCWLIMLCPGMQAFVNVSRFNFIILYLSVLFVKQGYGPKQCLVAVGAGEGEGIPGRGKAAGRERLQHPYHSIEVVDIRRRLPYSMFVRRRETFTGYAE